MERDDSVYRLRVAYDVKRLNVVCVVVLDRYDSPALDFLEIRTADRILKVALIDPVTLLDHYDRDTVTESAYSVRDKGGLTSFI